MKWKKIIILSGIVLLLGSSGAMADGAYKTIEVYLDRINVAINGQPANLNKDSLIYNGAVYVPLRSLSEMLGAEVSWDGANRRVNLDFITNKSEDLFNASQKGIYQYITIRNNQLMSDLLEDFKTSNTVKMKEVISGYEDLRQIALGIKDEEMGNSLGKIKAATELLRSGFESKKTDDYSLAWIIFKDNAARLNLMLKTKLTAQ